MMLITEKKWSEGVFDENLTLFIARIGIGNVY